MYKRILGGISMVAAAILMLGVEGQANVTQAAGPPGQSISFQLNGGFSSLLGATQTDQRFLRAPSTRMATPQRSGAHSTSR
jgi:hypothetical protein